MADRRTPDLERLPLRFDPPADARVRTAVGAGLLVHGALGVGSALGPKLHPKHVRSLERRWAHAVRRALRLTIRVEGLERIDPGRRLLVMPLHESFVDVPVLLHLPRPMRFVVRDELLGFPAMGRYLAATDQIPIVEDPRLDDLRALAARAEGVIERGEDVVVFPQGSVLGIESAFQAGAAWLARRLAVPILPVVISGTHRVWGYPFDTTVHYDETVTMAVMDPVEPRDATRSHLRSIERAMKRRALESATPPRRYVPSRDGWWDGYRFAIDPDFADLASSVADRRRSVDPRGNGDR